MKTCVSCDVEMLPTGFSPDRRASDGLQSSCRECCRERHRAAYRKDPARHRQRQRDYYKNNRELVLAINAKSRTKHADRVTAHKRAYYLRVRDTPEYRDKSESYRKKNKTKKRDYDRKYRELNREKLDEQGRAWKSSHPEIVREIRVSYRAKRRQIEAGGDSTKAIAEWTAAAEKVCFWCSTPCPDDFHTDHFMPLARGGKHEISNFAISCPTCNLKKNARDPYEFAASIGKVL